MSLVPYVFGIVRALLTANVDQAVGSNWCRLWFFLSIPFLILSCTHVDLPDHSTIHYNPPQQPEPESAPARRRSPSDCLRRLDMAMRHKARRSVRARQLSDPWEHRFRTMFPVAQLSRHGKLSFVLADEDETRRLLRSRHSTYVDGGTQTDSVYVNVEVPSQPPVVPLSAADDDVRSQASSTSTSHVTEESKGSREPEDEGHNPADFPPTLTPEADELALKPMGDASDVGSLHVGEAPRNPPPSISADTLAQDAVVEVDEAEAPEVIDLPSTVEDTSCPAQEQDAGVEADEVHTEAPVVRDLSLPVGETTRSEEDAVLEADMMVTEALVVDVPLSVGETAGPEDSVVEAVEALQAEAPVVRDLPSLVGENTEALIVESERAESQWEDLRTIPEEYLVYRDPGMLVDTREDDASSCGGDHEFWADQTEWEVSVFDPEHANKMDELSVLMQNLFLGGCGPPEVHGKDESVEVGDQSGMD